jgi:hypothetical protein
VTDGDLDGVVGGISEGDIVVGAALGEVLGV